MTKRLGALGGVAARQLSIRSVRSSTSSASASRPTDSAETCSTAKAGRAAICRVASTSQRGARDSGTARRSTCTATHDSAANTSTAAAKPPTAIRPSLRSLDTASSSPAKPSVPAASTSSEEALSVPTSRRMTRSGGTRASCSTGGRPKPSSRVSPTPRPKKAGHTPGGGSSVCTRPASSQMNTWCTPKPMATPSRLATTPTRPNSSPYDSAMERCGWPSTRSIAQSSRWRLAKSRAAMATATAASSAASSATRLRNFSPRSSVRRICGLPLSSDSTSTPRSASRSMRCLTSFT